MRESIFTTEMVHTFEYNGMYAYKIPDSPLSSGMNQGVAFTKPCDIVVGAQGKFIGVETKLLKKFEAFGLRHMQDSQIKHLTKMIEKGNRAFVFLNIRIASPFPKERENRLIIFDWSYLKERFEIGSIKKDELQSLAYTTKSPPIKLSNGEKIKGVFDLKLFYNLLNGEEITLEDF